MGLSWGQARAGGMGVSDPMDLTPLRAAPGGEDIETEVRAVGCELPRCGRVMLVAGRRGAR